MGDKPLRAARAMGRGQRWNPAQLRALRQAFGLSPEAFAARLGRVSGSTVRRWESGRHIPLIRQLEAIADAFDIDLAVFFEPANPGRRPRTRTPRREALPGQIELLPSHPPRARGAS
jgi:transcriptional regulator with XRE-family HTH domain